MERDALFVDVNVGEQGKPVRFCNTHLESLALDPPLRPLQMQLCAQYMHDSAVDGAVLAGDLNAIQDFDRRLHSDNDLKDAYLELGGTEDDAEAGHTWGQQAATAQRQKFGTSRMDNVFFCGGVVCTAFERLGAGIELQDEGEREEILKLGFDRPWITDHLGVRKWQGLVPHSLTDYHDRLISKRDHLRWTRAVFQSLQGLTNCHDHRVSKKDHLYWASALFQLSQHLVSLRGTSQPTSSQPVMKPVMLPCVTSSLPLSQTATASKAGPQELAKSGRNGDDAFVRGPVLYDLEPKYRRGPAIPVGKGIELNGQRLEPAQGQQGYGIYAPSSEENVIDFYPVNGGRLSSQKAPFQAPHSNPPPLEAPAKEPVQPDFIPFDWEPPNSGPDLVDPKFREVLAQVMSIVPPNVDTELKKARLFQETVGPMATYIRNIPGKQGRELHDMLINKCKELGIGRGLDCMRPSGLEE
ncbi:hypothetical protein KC367_g5860 [Hortaea werneckii]|nr:hypothetical protein KC367_g5860 [Hortaea werneckii]